MALARQPSDGDPEGRGDGPETTRSHGPAEPLDPNTLALRPERRRPFWRVVGPGLVTGAADDDPAGIGTYSVAGAAFGYGLLWLIPVCIPLMIAVQEMCGRIASVTGKGLAAVVKEHYAPWVLWGAVVLLFVANTMNVWADLNAMAASANMLFGSVPAWVWLVAITAATLALQILVPYRRYVRYLKWLALALAAYVVVALMPQVHVAWADVARGLYSPRWSRDPAFIMTVVGFIGTTISPYLFFWQAGETVEETILEGKAAEPGRRLRRATDDDFRRVRADTAIGMVASQVITFFIVVTTAATLHAHGRTEIATAQDAARALLPLGAAAYWLFSIGIVGTGLLAVPTLAGSAAYAVAESAGWRYGLYRRFARARGFYLTIGAVTVLGFALNFVRSVSPIQGLLYSAIINGVVAPPLIALLLLTCNDRRIVGERTNGPFSNVLGWLAVVLMTAAAGFMFWAMATGKAS